MQEADSVLSTPPTNTPADSRRSFLGRAAAAATGVAVVSTAARAMPQDASDAYLIKLGHQFDAMVQRIHDASARADELFEPIAKAIEAQATWPDDQHKWSRGDANNYAKVRNATIEEIGSAWVAANDEMELAFDPIDQLTRAIWAAPSTSVAGLGVKARAAAFAETQLWNKPFRDLDWGPKATRALIEAAFSAAGLPPVPEYLETENPEASADA